MQPTVHTECWLEFVDLHVEKTQSKLYRSGVEVLSWPGKLVVVEQQILL